VLSLPRAVTPAKVDSTHREAGKDGPARSLVFAKLVQLNGGPSGRNGCWVTRRPLTLVSQSAAASTSCPTGAEISASAFWGNAHGRRRHNARMRTPPTLPSVIGPTRSAEMNQWEAGVVVIRLPLGAPPTATGAALDFAGAEAPARSGETAPFVPSNGDGVCLQRT